MYYLFAAQPTPCPGHGSTGGSYFLVYSLFGLIAVKAPLNNTAQKQKAIHMAMSTNTGINQNNMFSNLISFYLYELHESRLQPLPSMQSDTVGQAPPTRPDANNIAQPRNPWDRDAPFDSLAN